MIGLLAVVVAAVAVRLCILLAWRGSRHSGGYVVTQIDKVADIVIFGLGILFVVWFRRARINAEHRGWPQRRARGWAFWGWVVPVVNLWIPFQLMGDIWRAGLPTGRRHKTAWLPALWWAGWLLSGVTFGTRAGHEYIAPQLAGHIWTGSLWFMLISGTALIAIIRAVSNGPVGSPRLDAMASGPHS